MKQRNATSQRRSYIATLLTGSLFVGGLSIGYANQASATTQDGTLTQESNPTSALPAAVVLAAEAAIAAAVAKAVLDERQAGEVFKARCRENDCDTSGGANDAEWEAALDLSS